VLTYLKGAGCSLLVATILYLTTVVEFETPPGVITSYDVGILFIALFNYLGCALGFLVHAALTRIRIKSIPGSAVIFILLGLAFSMTLDYIFELNYKFYFITIAGSLVYYLAQLITNRHISIVLSFLGPLTALSFFLYFA
jgi:hypothetical protein